MKFTNFTLVFRYFDAVFHFCIQCIMSSMDNFLKRLFGGGKDPPPMEEVEKAISLGLAAAGLERIAPDVLRLARRSIRIANRPARAEGVSGASHLGGQPDLPEGASWPMWKGAPMAFVGQVRLRDVAALAVEPALPSDGLLSFFYDSKQETYGADPADRGGWQVVYYHGDARLLHSQPFPASLPEASRFMPLPASFFPDLTLPSAPRQADPGLNWSDDETHRYEAWLMERFSPQERAAPKHRMFGYPDQIQDDMQVECALAAHGFHSPDEPGAAASVRAKADWLLLLQVDSEDRLSMRWGSAGMIYFWIERAALQQAHFDQTWLVQQSD
jgi:uncharacterized protein YwqG